MPAMNPASAPPRALEVSPWTISRSGALRSGGSNDLVTAATCACGSCLPGQPSSTRGNESSPNSAGSSPACWPVNTNVGRRPYAVKASATGLSLMASGLVPRTSLISAERSLPPSSAGGVCLHYGLSSSLAEIVGVGLELQPHGRRRDDVEFQPVLLAISDRGLFCRECEAHLRLGVARSVLSGQRISTLRLTALALELPAAGMSLARLGRLTLHLGNSGDGHRRQPWQSGSVKS